MKKHMFVLLAVISLMILPAWIGNTNTRAVGGLDMMKRVSINESLLEMRLESNAQLISIDEIRLVKDAMIDSIMELRKTQIEIFMDKLGRLESNNTYTIDNGKYMGAYQMGPSALKHLGLDSVTLDRFRKDPEIFPKHVQDWAVVELAIQNQKYLNNKLNVNRFVGKRIKGVKITKGGILAAAHLVGWYDCYRYLSSGGKYDPFDGNGTRAHDYMKKFETIDILAFDTLRGDLTNDLAKIWKTTKQPVLELSY